MINLYQKKLVKDGKVSEDLIRGESFFSIYNAKQSTRYTYSPGIEKKIMENYAVRKEQDFKSRVGISANDYLEKSSLHQEIFDSQKKFLDEMEQQDLKFKKATATVTGSLKDFIELQENTKLNKTQMAKLLADIKRWEKTTQRYLNTMSKVGNSFANQHNLKVKNISGQTPRGLAVDKKAVTSYEKASLLLGEMRKNMDVLEADVNKVKDLKIVTPVVKGGRLGYNFDKETKIKSYSDEKEAAKLMMEGMGGYISSTKGIVFEVAVANALVETGNKMIGEVLSLGSAKGITIRDSNGRRIGEDMRTSKTDVAYKDSGGFQINLSLKNQPITDTKKVSTSYLVTSLARYLSLVSESEYQSSVLAGILLTSDTIKSKNSMENIFLSALIADMAIGSGGVDAVDFLVFNNGIISLGDYYREVTGGLGLTAKLSEKQTIGSLLAGRYGSPDGKLSVRAN